MRERLHDHEATRFENCVRIAKTEFIMSKEESTTSSSTHRVRVSKREGEAENERASWHKASSLCPANDHDDHAVDIMQQQADQAKPSRADPSQAKPSQVRPGRQADRQG